MELTDPKAQLADAARRLERLLRSAATPSRREVARLQAEAPAAKSRLSARKAAAALAMARVASWGWVPFVGASLKAESARAEAQKEAASDAMGKLRQRARAASDSLAMLAPASAKASRVVTVAQARMDHVPASLAGRVDVLARRVAFLEGSDGREAARAHALGPKACALAFEAAAIVDAWVAAPVRSAPDRSPVETSPTRTAEPGINRSVEPVGKTGRSQLALDFDGRGQVGEGMRIWLPVSQSRTHEMVAKGARVDREASHRGSRLWVPFENRGKFESVLPLAYREKHAPLSFPPIAANAAGQNLWTVFDRDSWNHVRSAAYDRNGHRCQICGNQGGSLWKAIATPEERARPRLVECHEVWSWKPVDRADGGIGVQKLERLLTVCPDCHQIFHEGHALHKARATGRENLERLVGKHIEKTRILVNRTDPDALAGQLARDREAWNDVKSIGTWVLDLSHLSHQDFMADHTLVLQDGNRAEVTPSQIGGIAFMTQDGTSFAAQEASTLAAGEPARVLSGSLRNA